MVPLLLLHVELHILPLLLFRNGIQKRHPETREGLGLLISPKHPEENEVMSCLIFLVRWKVVGGISVGGGGVRGGGLVVCLLVVLFLLLLLPLSLLLPAL